jgi:hypothetical protein
VTTVPPTDPRPVPDEDLPGHREPLTGPIGSRGDPSVAIPDRPPTDTTAALRTILEDIDSSWHDEGDHIVWEEPRLVEGLIDLRDTLTRQADDPGVWKETARQYAENADYWRSRTMATDPSGPVCPNCEGQPVSPDCAICGGSGKADDPSGPLDSPLGQAYRQGFTDGREAAIRADDRNEPRSWSDLLPGHPVIPDDPSGPGVQDGFANQPAPWPCINCGRSLDDCDYDNRCCDDSDHPYATFAETIAAIRAEGLDERIAALIERYEGAATVTGHSVAQTLRAALRESLMASSEPGT